MKITYLGQAGLMLESQGLRVIVDPYLSNSVVTVNPRNWRRQPIDESFFDLRPDVLVFTHDHLDHYDPDTAERFLQAYDGITVLAPGTAWQKAKQFGKLHNYVLFERHTQWTHGHLRFTAVKATHSDPYAIGVIIEDGEKTYYITGDTLYNTEIFADLPKDIDVVFLPVNGLGNNMNATDAARFFRETGGKVAVPFHVGMFDDLTAENFEAENKVIPVIYEEIKL